MGLEWKKRRAELKILHKYLIAFPGSFLRTNLEMSSVPGDLRFFSLLIFFV